MSARRLISAALCLLLGCAMPSSAPQPEAHNADILDRRQRADSIDEASYGDPTVENPAGDDDAPGARPLRVQLTAVEPAWPVAEGRAALAVATVVDGWLQGSSPAVSSALGEAFGTRLEHLVELLPGDFLPGSVLQLADLCLAAHAAHAELLLIYQLDSTTAVWKLTLWRPRDATLAGAFAGRDAGFVLCSQWEPAAVWANAALLAAYGCLGDVDGEEP